MSDLRGALPEVAPGAVLKPGLLRARRGRVTAFDVAVGIGEVLAEDGESYRFHCSAIAGGARVIALDTRVIFSLAAFHRGEIQASDLIETT